MDRFPTQQIISRQRGPAPGAPGDGLAQGMSYTAVVQSAPSGGQVEVTIPALHLSQSFKAHVQPGLSPAIGEVCLVLFDEGKQPWVVALTGTATTAALEARVAALESLGPKTAASAAREHALTVGFGVFERVPVDTLMAGSTGLFDLVNGYYVVPATGTYHIDGWVAVAKGTEQTGLLLADILVSGTQTLRGNRGQVPAGDEVANAGVSGLIDVLATQRIELSIFHTIGGTSRAIEVSALENRLSVYRVA